LRSARYATRLIPATIARACSDEIGVPSEAKLSEIIV
jgi:hypothetical protein